jgi:CDP-diacylglycerol--glycerol-3-phosphate 3-phosphatidyltransferase
LVIQRDMRPETQPAANAVSAFWSRVSNLWSSFSVSAFQHFPVNDSSKRLWTLANILSIGRLLLLGPLFFFLRQGKDGNLWAMGVMCAALLTDLLDGFIARHFHQESDWGKVLDPLADKIWIGFLALFLAMPWRNPPLPWYFLVLLLIRYGLNLSGGWYAYSRTGVILTSNWVGKVTMVCEAMTLIVYTIYMNDVFEQAIVPDVLMWITIVMMVVSTLAYARRYRAVLSAAHNAAHLSNPSSTINIGS